MSVYFSLHLYKNLFNLKFANTSLILKIIPVSSIVFRQGIPREGA